jgi:2-polyprenyl-6-methoxyphenol hydroxylase-like FAD-dependent oxidoreductase
MAGGRVAVIGGSIAGCAAALAAHRTGADEVTIFERSTGGLEDRGVGVVMHSDISRLLENAGYADPERPTCSWPNASGSPGTASRTVDRLSALSPSTSGPTTGVRCGRRCVTGFPPLSRTGRIAE